MTFLTASCRADLTDDQADLDFPGQRWSLARARRGRARDIPKGSSVVTNVSGDYAPGLDLRELPELAAADAGQAERDRHLTPRVFEAIWDAGFPRHFVPMQWKGNEGGFLPYLTAVAEVARKDASAGWCAAIAGTLSRMAAFLPDEGQAALWAQGPDSFVASTRPITPCSPAECPAPIPSRREGSCW